MTKCANIFTKWFLGEDISIAAAAADDDDGDNDIIIW